MTNITRVDQAVLRLRAQLQRLARERAQRPSRLRRLEQEPLERLREVRGEMSVGDDTLRRHFIRALLTEELGEAFGNQPEFERISNEVWRILDEDAETKIMIDESIRRIGGSAS